MVTCSVCAGMGTGQSSQRNQPCIPCHGMGFKAYSCPHCQRITASISSAGGANIKAQRNTPGRPAQGGSGGCGGIGIGAT